MSASTAWVHGVASDRDNRQKDDWYATPPEAVRALVKAEQFEGEIADPCCGDGAIAIELEAAGYAVVSSDLVDRGYGVPRVDFLMQYWPSSPNIVMNPPFKLAEQFVMKALKLTTGKVAVLARLAFLEGMKRRVIFESTPLARVHVFSRRLTMWRGGEATSKNGSMIAFAWFVWEHGHEGKPELGWL